MQIIIIVINVESQMNGFFLNDVDLIQLKIVCLFVFLLKSINQIMILVPPVQSILPNTSTTIDESAAASDVKLFKSNLNLTFCVFLFCIQSNQACSSASSVDSHLDDYVLAQKPISITGSRLTDEQMVRRNNYQNENRLFQSIRIVLINFFNVLMFIIRMKLMKKLHI